MTICIIQKPTEKLQKIASDILEEAKSIGFETVIVFGLMDGEIHIRSSSMASKLQLIGALEMAKIQICSDD